MKKKIAVLPGDGIGAEVMEQAVRVLSRSAAKHGHEFETVEGLVGGTAWEAFGEHFPAATRKLCEESDAILFGSVGGPVSEQSEAKWRQCEARSILAIRKTFSLHANFRPVRVYPGLEGLSSLKRDAIARGVNLLFVRELNGDIYFGEHRSFRNSDGRRVAVDVAEYTEDQIASVAHTAFQAAMRRRNRLTSVDKANVLDTSKLWREVVHEVARDYRDVVLNDMLVDNCAMQLIRDPSQFDVVLTSNMFGDILSDAAAVLPGSLGLLPSASVNAAGFGLFEPSGGSAPDIAGKRVANPIAQILAVAMMLHFAFSLSDEADEIDRAVFEAIKAGFRTADIAGPGDRIVDTATMTDSILTFI
jgi:3-isopropylmalate dehydrogenase